MPGSSRLGKLWVIESFTGRLRQISDSHGRSRRFSWPFGHSVLGDVKQTCRYTIRRRNLDTRLWPRWPNALVPRFQFPGQDVACDTTVRKPTSYVQVIGHGTDQTKPQVRTSSTLSSQITEILMTRLSGNYARPGSPYRPAIVDENGLSEGTARVG
jgi:hypothetical protein